MTMGAFCRDGDGLAGAVTAESSAPIAVQGDIWYRWTARSCFHWHSICGCSASSYARRIVARVPDERHQSDRGHATHAGFAAWNDAGRSAWDWRPAGHGAFCHLVRRRGARGLQSRRSAAPFVPVQACHRRVRRSPCRRPDVCDRILGIALSDWTYPFAEGEKRRGQLQLGRESIERGNSVGAKTERERSHLTAVGKLFADFESSPQRVRFIEHRDAMRDVAAKYPADREAQLFYALALAAPIDADIRFLCALISENTKSRPVGSLPPIRARRVRVAPTTRHEAALRLKSTIDTRQDLSDIHPDNAATQDPGPGH